MREIKAIFFDCGGTLIEGQVPWHELFQLSLRLVRHPLPLKEMVTRYEAAVRRMTADKQAAASFGTAKTAKAPKLDTYVAQEFGLSEGVLRNAVDEVLYDYPEARHLVCVDGVVEVLTALKSRGYRLGVISNWSADLPQVLSLMSLKQHFEGIFASEAMGYAKPHAASFLIPLERLGLTPGQAAYVGDLYDVDCVGAREVGLTPVLYDPLRLHLHRDVPNIGHFSELLSLFLGV